MIFSSVAAVKSSTDPSTVSSSLVSSRQQSAEPFQRLTESPHTLLHQLDVVLPPACPGSAQEVASQSNRPRRCLYQVPDPPRLLPLVLRPDPEAPFEIRTLSCGVRPSAAWGEVISASEWRGCYSVSCCPKTRDHVGEGQNKELSVKMRVWLCGSAPSSQWSDTTDALL